MLNIKKKIVLKIEKKIKNPKFFNLPILPLNSYLQTGFDTEDIIGSKLIFNNSKARSSVRFLFNSKFYRAFGLFVQYKKQKIKKDKNFKNHLLFFNRLYKNSKRYPLFFLRKIKGGFVTRSLGIQSFMPKSHRLKKKELIREQLLLKIKAFQRKKKKNFSSKNRFKINLVSSAKNSKRKKLNQDDFFYREKLLKKKNMMALTKNKK